MISEASGALGIRFYDAKPADLARIRSYLQKHTFEAKLPADLSLGGVYLHNDSPRDESWTPWQTDSSVLVFRGSKRSYELTENQIFAVADDRFHSPVIIRDSWRERNVMTRMQTKSVLAWSKSFKLALEYALGCVGGGGANRTPGYLHFAVARTFVDVEQVVSDWERGMGGGIGPIDPGNQKEILTPSMAKTSIIATWELTKGDNFAWDDLLVRNKQTHQTNCSAGEKVLYNRIQELFETNLRFSTEALGLKVNREIISL